MTLPEKPEPSVLDYLKSRLSPGKNPAIKIPAKKIPDVILSSLESSTPVEEIKPEGDKRVKHGIFWLLIVLLLTLLVGQKLLEPPGRSVPLALVFWGCAVGLILLNWFHGNFDTNLYPYIDEESSAQTFRPLYLGISLFVGFIAFLLFTRNRFTATNVSLWVVSILCLIPAFFPIVRLDRLADLLKRLYRRIFYDGFRIHFSPWTLLWLCSFLLVTFFRFYRLNQIPLEMISDHAEKLLDVNDILGGTFSIFFPRNTGREGFQMYLSAAVALIFKTGISFLTLKIGTALMGLFTAVYMYFLGKEAGNRWVGLFAFILCGIGYWPNVISRIGLRFTLYSAFTAPALYYFFKGMRRKRLTDLVWAGIFIGLGLQGYSPYRLIPILIIIGVVLYQIHCRKLNQQKFALIALFIAGITALILFLPLLRYILDQPDLIVYRALTRAWSLERPLPGPAWQIFMSNLWWAFTMPFYLDGTIWVHSIPMRPALDVVGGALYLLGLIVCILRYIQQRDWRIPFLIFAVPFLMLPSIISLAFPGENPCLNRTAGALVPIFLIAAMGLDTLLQNIKRQFSHIKGSIITAFVGGMVLLISIFQNYDLVFNTYNNTYIRESLNTSQIGSVVRSFINLNGDPDSAYVVGYPYWVDTRLVGMIAGYPTRDYAIWPDEFNLTLANPNTKLFILNPKDTSALEELRTMYPDSYETRYKGRIPSKDFIMLQVPPSANSSLVPESPVQ